MKHFAIVLVVALITLTGVFAAFRPDVLEDVWLWMIGLAGPVIGATREGIKRFVRFIGSLEESGKSTQS